MGCGALDLFGDDHVGAPAKQHVAPHTGGIVRRQRPANGVEFSACRCLAISGNNQVPDEWRTEALNMIRLCRQSGLADPDQATAEHHQDAATGLDAARMVACLAWRDGRKHDRGTPADIRPLARARPRALAIRLGAGATRSVPRHRCRTVSQEVEAASDPGRSDDARVSGALIVSWVATSGMLNLRRLGYSLGRREPGTFPLPAPPRRLCRRSLDRRRLLLP